MHKNNQIPYPQPILRCDYDQAYQSMYDSSYGTGFVFYDDEELETDDGYDTTHLPVMDISPSGLN